MQNVDKLQGDFLQFALHYILSKMAQKEITMLGAIDLNADNGTINLSALDKFREHHWDRYNELKDHLHIYTVGN